MTQINKDIIEQTMHITDLPIFQKIGVYIDDETPCCIGARLAGFFMTSEYDDYDFRSGIDEFARRLGGNRAHVILMLRTAGAGYNPLSSEDWPISPKEVWQNLSKMEMLPPLRGKKFSNIDFTDADLSGSDLQGADFSMADFYGADLQGADLQGARLHSAHLCYTDLRSANLAGSNINNIYLTDIITDSNTIMPENMEIK